MPIPTAGSETTVTLGQVIAALRRRTVTVAAISVCGAVLAAFAGLLSPPSFSATSVVSLTPADNPFSTSSSTKAVNTATEVQVVRSTHVGERVKKAMGLGVPVDELLNRVTVSSPTDSAVLKITYTAAAPAEAAAGANTFAEQYLSYRTELASARITASVATLDKHIARLQSERTAAKAAAATSQSGSERSAAAVTVSSLTSLIAESTQQRARLEATQVGAGDLVGRAEPPPAESLRHQLLLVFVGGAVGLVLGAVVAFVRDAKDPAILDVQRIEALVGLPVLVDVPVKAGRSLAPTPEQREAYRRLAMLLRNAGHLRGPLAVVGTDTTNPPQVAAWLACAVARHVAPISLLCTAEVVSDNLSCVTSASGGSPQPDVRGLGCELDLRPEQDLRAAAGGSDLLVVDGVNVAYASTALALGAMASRAVIVARLGQTRSDELRRMASDLAASGVELAGVVLLRPARLRRSLRRTPAVQAVGATTASSGSADEGVGVAERPALVAGATSADLPTQKRAEVAGVPAGGASRRGSRKAEARAARQSAGAGNAGAGSSDDAVSTRPISLLKRSSGNQNRQPGESAGSPSEKE